MRYPTKHEEKNIEWDQIPAGTIMRKFVATDVNADDENPYRVVIHGFVDDGGNVYITNELMTSDPVIVGQPDQMRDEP